MACTIQFIEPNQESGFFWPFLVRSGDPSKLLVAPNNTGIGTEDLAPHVEKARCQIGAISELMPDVTVLVPIFPRWSAQKYCQHYTHSLNRATMLTASNFDSQLVRLDLQLLSMVAYARRLEMSEADRFMVFGFSAAGQFANRFAILHPERVTAVVAGSCGGHMVPVEEWKGEPLRYPIGTLI